MKKRIKNLLAVVMAVMILFQPSFVSADVSAAVTYILAQSQDAWTTMALAAADQTGIPTSHLTSVSGSLATDYAKAILALAAVGQNPTTFGNIDYVTQLKSYYNNNQMGDETLLNDDVWSILALAAVGEISSSQAISAKNFLLANQNSDGGWSYAVNGVSDTNDTASAIIALVEAGISASNAVITSAISYLQSAQNADGGFGWMAGFDSDSGSDAWVITALNKINQDASSWDQSGNNPVSHLESLQDSDGGFWWVQPGTSDFNNKSMTSFAVIALSGASYPIDYYQISNSQDEDPQPDTYHLRLEGQNNTICDVYISADTALNIVENGSSVCGYTYTIQDTAFGPYLSAINSEQAQGMSGWMYFVNNISQPVGAQDYILNEGDEVLWYYGEWGWQPTALSFSSDELASGQNLTITVKYFDGQSWLPLEDATVNGASQNYSTDSTGQVVVSLPDGYYTFYAEKQNFIRSNSESVQFGDGVSRSVGLVVEIDQAGTIAGESIIFEVSPSQLDFGKIKPGQVSSQVVFLSNSGTVDLALAAVVSGDSVFSDNISIDGQTWADYADSLAVNQNKQVDVSLLIPAGYIGSGIKTGEMIFWASPQ